MDQNNSDKTESQVFRERLEKANEIVTSWPDWKQQIMGGLVNQENQAEGAEEKSA